MNHFIWHGPGGGEAPVITSYLPSLLCRAVVPPGEHSGAGKGMAGLISTCRRERGEGAESLEGCRMLIMEKLIEVKMEQMPPFLLGAIRNSSPGCLWLGETSQHFPPGSLLGFSQFPNGAGTFHLLKGAWHFLVCVGPCCLQCFSLCCPLWLLPFHGA